MRHRNMMTLGWKCRTRVRHISMSHSLPSCIICILLTLPAYYVVQGLCNGRLSVCLFFASIAATCRFISAASARAQQWAGSVHAMIRAEGSTQTFFVFLLLCLFVFVVYWLLLWLLLVDIVVTECLLLNRTTTLLSAKPVTSNGTLEVVNRFWKIWWSSSVLLRTLCAIGVVKSGFYNVLHGKLAVQFTRTCSGSWIVYTFVRYSWCGVTVKQKQKCYLKTCSCCCWRRYLWHSCLFASRSNCSFRECFGAFCEALHIPLFSKYIFDVLMFLHIIAL